MLLGDLPPPQELSPSAGGLVARRIVLRSAPKPLMPACLQHVADQVDKPLNADQVCRSGDAGQPASTQRATWDRTADRKSGFSSMSADSSR